YGCFFFFQAEDGIRDPLVTGVQTCALPIYHRRTLLTELGVFETFTPSLPISHQNSPFVLLANIAPSLQHHVLNQMQRPKFVVARSEERRVGKECRHRSAAST